MEIVFASAVGLTAVVVTLLSVITARQQREIEALWHQIGDLNQHLIAEMTANEKIHNGTRASFEILGDIVEALVDMKEKNNG